MVILPAVDSCIIKKYITIQEIYSIILHHPVSYLATLQRGVYYFRIKVFSHLRSSQKVCLMWSNYLDLV